MRNTIIGLIIGFIVGAIGGATVIAPEVERQIPGARRFAMPSLPSPDDKGTQSGGETGSAVAQEGDAPSNSAPVNWRMASAYPASLPQLGTMAKRLETLVGDLSDGRLAVAFHEPGTLVPREETFEAVRSGAIDAAFATPASWPDKNPALELFASIPFGPPTRGFLAWFYFGGGEDHFEEVYARLGVHALACGLIAPEAAGWFKKPITAPADFQGLRMRITGLGAKVAGRLGA